MQETTTTTEVRAVKATRTTDVEIYIGDRRIKVFSNLDDAIIWASPRPFSHNLYFEIWNKSELVKNGQVKELL
jgi:hypothetical protein